MGDLEAEVAETTTKKGDVGFKDIYNAVGNMTFSERISAFGKVLRTETKNKHNLYRRVVNSSADRSVQIIDPLTGRQREMLMFGSNNYLGLATHPYVVEYVRKTIKEYGVGVGGPPLLNGYTRLHQDLEERLAAFKKKESCMLFSSGYNANVGLVTGLMTGNDFILFDEYMHASFCDGMKMGRIKCCNFRHNDVNDLELLLKKFSVNKKGSLFVAVEGVYSMIGDMAPLDKIARLCKSFDAVLIVDDAHGTGVLGTNGRGTADHFAVHDEVPIIMGTFSKSFGVTGGFLCSSKQAIDYIRFFARSYIFSASLPPVAVAAILAGLDVMENEPALFETLKKNIAYAVKSFNSLNFSVNTKSAIIALPIPEKMDIREAAWEFHVQGIFLNSVEYPAVPLQQQRFRISIMATHTREDIDRLVETVDRVWKKLA